MRKGGKVFCHQQQSSFNMRPLHFSNRLGAVGQRCSQSNSAFCVKVMSYQVFTEAKSSCLNGNSEGSVQPRSGVTAVEQPITEPHQRPARNMDGFGTRAAKSSMAIIHWPLHMKEGEEKTLKIACCFTLPYLLFILLQNFTRTIANLHTLERNTEGQKQQKIKTYFSSKKA